ncbi:uncharacterized protein B0H18DRAFT_110482 [Fomitopsis serialis]|uniref:uncharacterized protein n=1 Tax=Fomitopsis serialis TaxID=139415 RepID=UPI002008CF74|nr:uncharacterized protein B0H18DRAFT_110482 [Neoantrodia serialis]KAH9915007.1 hypothetical protein B0H18DRAFT_110482 [Neoantrodia serialis]
MSAYRRRDNAASGYSSADAYRAVPSTSPSLQHARAVNSNGAASSSEEDHLTSQATSPAPVANVFVRTRAGSRSRPRRDSQEQGGEPLSPPRPGFLAGDRRSWSASSGASEAEGNSDSDVPAAGLAGVGAGASQSARPPAGTNAGRVPVRGHDRVRSNSNSQQAGRSPAVAPQTRARNHRRRSSMANEYAYAGSAGEEEPQSPSSQGHSSFGISNPFGTPNDTPRNSFYGAQGAPAVPEKINRSPPSAFPSFPFQSHAGNPDPGTVIPGIGRRESLDSLAALAQNGQILHTPANLNNHPLSPPGSGTAYPTGAAPGGYGLVEESEDLGRPFAPFMGDVPERAQTPSSAGSQLYRNSAAAAVSGKGEYADSLYYSSEIGSDNGHGLPRTGSGQQISMRAPFLSPASRPTSSLWAPPSFPYAYPPGSGSSTALGGYAGSGILGQYSSYADIQAQLRKSKPIMPSSKISQKLTKEDKPWLLQKDSRSRASYWLTLAGVFAGIAGAAVLCYFTWVDTYFLADSQVCSYFYDDFSGGLDTTNNWNTDNELGGFG